MKKHVLFAIFVLIASATLKAQVNGQPKPVAVKQKATIQQQNGTNRIPASNGFKVDSGHTQRINTTPATQNQQNGANRIPASNGIKLDDLKNPFDTTKKVKTVQQQNMPSPQSKNEMAIETLEVKQGKKPQQTQNVNGRRRKR